MSWKSLIALLLIILLGGAVAIGVQLTFPIHTEVDTVALNEIVHTVRQKWPSFNEIEDQVGTVPFAVLDPAGNLLYETRPGQYEGLESAFRQRMPIVDLVIDGEPAGQIIMYSDVQDSLQQIRHRLVWTTLIFSLSLAVFGGIFMLILYRTLVRPFSKLQVFARNIALGRLDSPLQMERSNWFGAFTESFDIMREELAAAKKSEYEANRSKKELVATLSHDIKTPIASIKAISELLLLQLKEEKSLRQVNTIHAKAEQINLLITDMFHATMEELQELKVTPKEIYSTVLNEMIAGANIDDRIAADPVPECIIQADPVRLQQVLDNLISNSLKYAGTSIHITSMLTPTHLMVQIDDYGPGVAEEELPLILNKFYRGSNASGKSGAGLGLYISHYFMQQMQGELECLNRTDGFTVMLLIKLDS
ncbi:HAMP domain-containing sensor histidine kinase [Paenibacillus brevis]|uniref:histidine kinase n=1 Tax=Paenibacillus brevis TaxID=2841508 RepID=A0ABS6FJW0_9BACL|nr:HAMP domain-containing sensor histidine kinase [Paenibacillus brevis]MBU5670467.1 HAMP domain-containing histidine kinase [Paenibacillus brevis]